MKPVKLKNHEIDSVLIHEKSHTSNNDAPTNPMNDKILDNAIE